MLKTIHDPKAEECNFYTPKTKLAAKKGYVSCANCDRAAETNRDGTGKVFLVRCEAPETPETRKTIKKEEARPMKNHKKEEKKIAPNLNNKKVKGKKRKAPAKSSSKKINRKAKKQNSVCKSRSPEYRAKRRRLIKEGKWKVGKGRKK